MASYIDRNNTADVQTGTTTADYKNLDKIMHYGPVDYIFCQQNFKPLPWRQVLRDISDYPSYNFNNHDWHSVIRSSQAAGDSGDVSCSFN